MMCEWALGRLIECVHKFGADRPAHRPCLLACFLALGLVDSTVNSRRTVGARSSEELGGPHDPLSPSRSLKMGLIPLCSFSHGEKSLHLNFSAT